MIVSLTENRLIYLDTGEIFEADEIGECFGDPVATLEVGVLDDDAHALGQAMAAAPELVAALLLLQPTNVGVIAASIPDSAIIPLDMTAGELRQWRAALSKAGAL